MILTFRAHRKPIANGAAKDAYYAAHDKVVAVAGVKEVWTTETGWPIKGDDFGAAVASVENLQQFWWDVACGSFALGIPMFWYILVRCLFFPMLIWVWLATP
jgi:exo-beta-1,3-glucanase (GH17 family)